MKSDLRPLCWCACSLLLLFFCSCDVHKKLGEMDFKQGMKKIDAGDIAGASNDFSGAIEQDPNLTDAYLNRGYILLLASNYDLAFKDYDKAISLDPANAYAYRNLGLAKQGLLKFAEAMTNFSESIKLEPTEADGYAYRANVKTDLRDWEGAIDDFNEALKLNQSDPEIYCFKASAEMWNREFENAVTDATRAIELNNKTNQVDKVLFAYQISAYAKVQLKEYDGALEDLDKAIQLRPHNPEILAERGSVHVCQNDFKAAEEDIAEAVRLAPTNHDTLSSLTDMKRKSGDLEGALPAVGPENRRHPARRFPQRRALSDLGYLQSDLFQFAPALESFRKGIKLDPKMYYGHFRIWIIRARLGEKEEATRELKAVIKERENDRNCDWELCVARFLAGDVTESNLLVKANETITRPTDVLSQQCEAFYYAGMKRLLDGDKSAAAGFFEKCVASKDDNDAERC